MNSAFAALIREPSPARDGLKRHMAWRLPADQPGEEDSFLRCGVERSDLRHLTCTGPDRGREADVRQLTEALLRLGQFSCIVLVEKVTAVAGTVHHNLDRHAGPSFLLND